MRIGYAMTSGADEGLEAQIAALTQARCERIYTDAISGTSGEHKGFDEALAYLSPGDTLVVCALDRASRSQKGVLELLALLHERHAGFLSLGEGVEVMPGDDRRMLTRNFAALAGFPETPAFEVSVARSGPLSRQMRPRTAALILGGLACVAVLYALCFAFLPRYDRYTGRVVSTHVLTASGGSTQQSVTVTITSGNLRGHDYSIQQSYPTGFASSAYSPGDNVLVGYNQSTNSVFLDNYDRRGATFALLLIFLALIVLVARRQGFLSIVGMAFSVVVILLFVAPSILRGMDPLLAAVLSAFVIIPVTYYLAHGLQRKTTVAILATFVTLALTFLLAALFARWMKLPLVASVDDATLYYVSGGRFIDAQSLYLAGLVIGALAVLNDITISQASIVASLAKSNPSLGLRALFTHAMDVGKDHVASLINTLILVYVGASFSLFLSITRGISYGSFGLSDPTFAADLLRTVVVSIGVVAAVPVSTALAAYLTLRERR